MLKDDYSWVSVVLTLKDETQKVLLTKGYGGTPKERMTNAIDSVFDVANNWVTATTKIISKSSCLELLNSSKSPLIYPS